MVKGSGDVLSSMADEILALFLAVFSACDTTLILKLALFPAYFVPMPSFKYAVIPFG